MISYFSIVILTSSRFITTYLACDGRKLQKTTGDQQQEMLGILHPTEDGHHETPRNMSDTVWIVRKKY